MLKSILCIGLALGGVAAGEEEAKLVVKSCTEIGKVWAGHPVGFAFEARPDGLYIGFYDHERRMVIGHRKPDAKDWTLQVTDERVGWDSHNSIAFGFDRDGGLHVAANMHCRSLRYWRTEKPGDVASLRAVHRMTGQDEGRCTYPQFFTASDGRLLFLYRDGGSGNGRRFLNAYDETPRSWARWLDKPLLSGVPKMNAYPTPIVADGRGVFHIAWVWRDTPDCSTNHDLSYARSRDLKTWETSDGRPIELPMTLKNAEVVDPVPARGGMLNNVKLSFDHGDRPLIAYHKFDANGHTQLYLARREKEGWKTYQTTKWDYRWYFQGGGCIVAEIGYSAATPWRDGKSLAQSFFHPKAGSGSRLLDGETLQPTGETPRSAPWPPEVRKLESDFPGMRVNVRTCESGGTTYALRWETLGANRDRPRPADQTPPPSRLLLYELTREEAK
ncbi:MAG TPA: BNR repeat-containing protein [Planctomycetota bacterium]|nr:BNR repeat-containing protein [Planctomycetota bacterium]